MSIKVDVNQALAVLRDRGFETAASALENSIETAGGVCRILGFKDGDAITTTATTTKEDCGCKGGGGGAQPAIPVMTRFPAELGGYPFFAARAGLVPACYANCRVMDPCLSPYLEDAFLRFDNWSWRAMSTKDPIVVHLNKVVGAGDYVTALPLTPGDKILYAQEDAQMLPYNPGGIKVDPKWSAAAAPSEVIVRLFAGKNGLTGLTGTSGLIQIGADLTLADFECKDDCYILAWPLLDGCITGPIPDLRSLYVELEAKDTMGATTITSLSFTILKKGTQRYVASCKNWGWDANSGCSLM